jgi:hypothetical protein
MSAITYWELVLGKQKVNARRELGDRIVCLYLDAQGRGLYRVDLTRVSIS